MDTFKHYREQHSELLDQAEAIMATADQEKRDLTADESQQFKRIMQRCDLLQRQAEAAEPIQAARRTPIAEAATVAPPAKWQTYRGDTILALKPHHRMRDLVVSDADDDAAFFGAFAKNHKPSMPSETCFGNIVRAIATGDWKRFAASELKNLGGGSTAGGGILVPHEVSTMVLDNARAASRVLQAGAITVPMESESLTIAKVTSDPSFEVKAENAAFTGSDPVFGGIELTSHTIGTYCTLSRELAADAPNIAEVVQGVLSRALATELDRMAIAGTGSQEWNGLVVNGDIGSTSSVGAIAWEDLATAVVGIQASNYQPNAYIMSPTIGGDLSVLASGDAANSAKMWLGPPPNVERLTPLVTTSCADANLFVGQWDQCVFGLRSEAIIESSTVAENAFAKHQLLIKIVFRGDFGVMQPAAFHRLDGITT